MHITIRQLQVFDSVARNLSYTRAAEELHLDADQTTGGIRWASSL